MNKNVSIMTYKNLPFPSMSRWLRAIGLFAKEGNFRVSEEIM
jgi:hypothetical protein